MRMKDREQERRGRKGGGERKWEKKRGTCGNERAGDRCGPSKEINFSASWGASCAVFLMTKMRGKGKKGQDDHGLYIHTSPRFHICAVWAVRLARGH